MDALCNQFLLQAVLCGGVHRLFRVRMSKGERHRGMFASKRFGHNMKKDPLATIRNSTISSFSRIMPCHLPSSFKKL